MKNIYKHIALIIPLVSLLAMNSCDKGFQDVNVDSFSLTTIDPDYLFSNAEQLTIMSLVDYDASIVQQVITVQPGTLAGANFNIDLDINTRKLFDNYSTGPLKNIYMILNATKNDPKRVNLYNMTRILKAYVFMQMVDAYGDVPYTEAGQAFLTGIYLPKYDAQATIYDDILKELSDATKSLDATQAIPTQELIYAGNIPKWKKLGNSLLLRAAMRFTKVDAAKAKANVLIALDPANGGVIEAVADNAKISFNTTFSNSAVGAFQGSERGNYYLGEPFVNYLKATNDPRLSRIAVRYQTPAGLFPAATGTADTISSHQIGMPFGYNGGNIVTAPNFPGILGAAFAYSQPNRATVTAQGAQAVIISASQTLLLKAEAAQRTYITGSAATFYNAGVKAHMDMMAVNYTALAITASSQDAYLAANPFDPAKALEMINTQYWISSYTIWGEAWANFRRSGFPVLTPNPYPSQDPLVKGGFIRRMTYPDREWSVNGPNIQAAIDRQGPDNLVTRVFWDKQ